MRRWNSKTTFIILIMSVLITQSCNEKKPTETQEPTPADLTLNVPSEYPTIQDAMNHYFEGMEIVLADGIYSGTGNTDIRIADKSIKLRSENGPALTIIDCSGDSLNQHRAFSIENQNSTNTIIEGITIRNAFYNSGAAVYCKTTSPTFKNCIFQDNISTVSGGAIRCKSSSPQFINCTFAGNAAGTGGTIFLLATSSPILISCIIAFSDSGQSISIADAGSQPALSCCNIFGNVGGDWPNGISDQSSVNGNFSSDPLFCDSSDDFRLQSNSPCNPANNTCGVLIGALPEGCSR